MRVYVKTPLLNGDNRCFRFTTDPSPPTFPRKAETPTRSLLKTAGRGWLVCCMAEAV